jgi:hypothetical protein
MPQKADRLPKDEIALIEHWIDQGALFDGTSPQQPLVELARASLLRPAPEFYLRPWPITALAFSPDATQLAVSGYYEITIWNVADGSLLRRIGGLPERITSLIWHPVRNLIALAGGSPAQWGTVALIDPSADFQSRFLCDLPEVALNVAFSPDGECLVAGCGDRTVRMFQIPGGRQMRLLRQHADWVQSVAFSPDGKHLATASRDRTVRILNVASGEIESTYTGHDTPVTGVAFSGTGATVLSIGRGNSVHTWEAQSGSAQTAISDFFAPIQRIAVQDTRLITATSDGVVHVHQLSDHQPLFTLFGHRDAVEAIALSPQGELFATGSHDGEVLLWETVCGTWLRRFVTSPMVRRKEL